MGTEQSKLKPTITDPAYFEMCKMRCFLASKVGKQLGDIAKIRKKLEITYGAKMGAGSTRKYLEPRGFKDDEPLGASSIALNDDLALHHDDLDDKVWVSHYGEYASATIYGVLIFAGTVQNFQIWASSPACLEEVAQIKKGRLFVYIEHGKDDEGGRSGYIVHVDAENNKGSATVENRIGYVIWHSGNYYHGELKNGTQHGHGVHTIASGSIYDGEYKDGKYHGHGVYTFASGSIYDGEYKDGNLHGHGVYTFANGNVYDGEYKDGKRHGHGVLTFADGAVYDGEYKDDKQHGHGVYTYASGNVYDGEYKDDKYHGHGVYTFADGRIYDGEFKDGKYHGHGVYTFANGNVYDGEWKDGKHHGHGVETFADGGVYDGEFKDGKRHGNAIFTFRSGKKTKLVYENGKEISSTPI